VIKARTLLLPAAALAFAWAFVAAITGGIDAHFAGVAIRARGAFRPLLAGFVLLAAYAALNRDAFARTADRIAQFIARAALPIAVATSLLLGALTIVYGSFTAGGSDSYGYVSEAYGWLRGELPKPIPIPYTLSFPSSDMIQIPLGYHEGPQPHTMVPTYAVGLPLLMAAAAVAGECGPFLVTPISAVLLVWCTFLLARRMAGPATGAVAAVVIATAPVVLFQAMAPMSDVPAGACWTAALVVSLGSAPLAAGIFTAIGLLIRPNILPLVLVPFVAVATGASGRRRWASAALFAAPVALTALFIAAVNTTWYGSPGGSGYGNTRDLYSAGNIWPNIKLYAAWFWQSESPWAIVGVLALVPRLRPKFVDVRALALSVAAILVTLGCYLAYSTFDVWWYLRFLLPAAGAAAALIAVGVVALARAVPAPWGRLAACITLTALASAGVTFASRANVFGGLRDSERHYIEVGEFISSALPANAAIFAIQHSGSLRFYGGRMTLRFDWIDKGWESRAAGEIERIGLHPYLVVDDFELPQVRAVFGFPESERLPYPVVARMRELGGTTVFDLGSRPPLTAPVALEPGNARRCSGPGLTLRVK